MLNRFVEEKTIILFVFGSLICGMCLAQQDPKIDSLLNVIRKQKDDTGKVNTLNALSRRYWEKKDYTPGGKYAENALLLAGKLNFKKGVAASYTILGLIHTSMRNYSEAMNDHLASLKISEDIGFKKGTAYSYSNIGNIYFNQQNYPEAIKNYQYSLKIYEGIGDKQGLANAYYNIGNTYNCLANFNEALKNGLVSLQLSKEIGDKRNIGGRYIDVGNYYQWMGNYPEALKNQFAALKIFEETGNQQKIADTYVNIGNVYNKLGNYPEALKNHLGAIKIYQEIKYKFGIAIEYNNMGEVYTNSGNYTEALKNHLYALNAFEEIKYTYGIAMSYSNLGNLYFLQTNYPEAMKNNQAAVKLFEKMQDGEGLANTYNNMGEIYIELKKYPEARKFLNDALSVSKEIQSKEIIKDSYQNLAKLDSTTGNWEAAYRYNKLFVLYRDSLVNEENTKKITEAKMQYEFAKKEDSLNHRQALTDEELKQQTLLIQQQRQSLLLKETELTLSAREKELQQLEIEKNQGDYSVQKAEADKKQNQLLALNKEKEIQTIELKKQKQAKNFFIAGLALFAILSFFVYRNYRTRQKLKLLTLRNKIASDLHDDVGSTLSSISIFSQMAQQQSKEVIPMLETIEESSRKMLDAMADIVWTINPENDQFEKIILRMRSFAYELLGAKKIDFEFLADDDVAKINLPMEVRKNLYLIFKEATNNMVKYAGANKAMFAIKGEKNNLTMMIRDNGKGFDTDKKTEGNGLRNMKKRATEIGAELLIDSYPGNGTTIQLKIAV